MTKLSTPVCNFGENAHDFELKGTDNNIWSLDKCRGDKGLLVMFICNHCPFVKAILEKLVVETDVLAMKGIGVVAINPNDYISFPEDSFDNMQKVSKSHGFGFPYLIDDQQEIAKKYGSVCTPDFFGYNQNLELQYRGRIRELKNLKPIVNGDSDLKLAMTMIAETQKGPSKQIPSMGCNIKWFN